MRLSKLMASVLLMLTVLLNVQGCWFAAGAATGAAATEAAEEGDDDDADD